MKYKEFAIGFLMIIILFGVFGVVAQEAQVLGGNDLDKEEKKIIITEDGIEGISTEDIVGLIIFGIWGIFLFVFIVAVYVYTSLAWYRISKKLNFRNAWVAWIPIANLGLVLHLGGFHWAWTFLILIPILGWIALFVLSIIAIWRVFEKRKYPGWFSLSLIIPQVGYVLYLIAIGFVAWDDRKKRLFG